MQGSDRALEVLLVDDDHLSRRLIGLALTRLGVKHEIAGSGEEAVRVTQARGRAHDVILMDVMMRGMDGVETARAIRACGDVAPYIIAVTGGARGDDRQGLLSAGFDDHVAKPVDIELLKAALARARGGPTSPSPAPVKAPAVKAVDVEVLKKLARFTPSADLGDEFTVVVGDVLGSAEGLIGKLEQALARGDGEGVRVAAHTLKSNAAMLGALALRDAAAEIEHSAARGEVDERLVATAAGVRSRFRDARDEVQAFLDRTRGRQDS